MQAEDVGIRATSTGTSEGSKVNSILLFTPCSDRAGWSKAETDPKFDSSGASLNLKMKSVDKSQVDVWTTYAALKSVPIGRYACSQSKSGSWRGIIGSKTDSNAFQRRGISGSTNSNLVEGQILAWIPRVGGCVREIVLNCCVMTLLP